MEILVSNTFEPLLHDEHRYLVLCGGRGSGKSEFAARKIFYRCMTEGNHRFLVLRKVRKTCKESVVKVMQTLLRENEIEFAYNKTDHVLSFKNPLGQPNEILFDGLDEPEKIKSIKGVTGEWIEEATEFTDRDFSEIDLCFREPGPHYKQIIMSFNPDEAQARWLKLRFFDHIDPNATVHPSTVEDNPIREIREEYRRQLDAIQDETLRSIYRHGIWAMPKGRIFSWDVVPMAGALSAGGRVDTFDEIFYGGDFGYSVNPAVVVKIYRKANEYWLEEVLYQTGMTNQDIGEFIIDAGFQDATCYWDSAEQKSIEELSRLGTAAIPAIKGPDSVRAGIDFLKSLKIHIVAGSQNIIKEAGLYSWKKDRNGDPLPEPVKFMDHTMDAARYGIYTQAKADNGVFFGMTREPVY